MEAIAIPKGFKITPEQYRTGKQVEILNNPQTLSGENVLPGFVLDLSNIF